MSRPVLETVDKPPSHCPDKVGKAFANPAKPARIARPYASTKHPSGPGPWYTSKNDSLRRKYGKHYSHSSYTKTLVHLKGSLDGFTSQYPSLPVHANR